MKIKTETIAFSIWCVILFSRILINQEISMISSPLKIYYISSALLIVFMFLQWIRERKKLKNSTLLFWGVAFFLYIVLFGKVLVNNNLKELTEFTFNALLMFYMLVFVMASYVCSHEHREIVFVKITFWTFTFGIILSAVLNWDGTLGLSELISNIFGGYTRTRATFGFYHANAAANIALCVIIMSSYLIYISKKRILYITIDMFMTYIILATASRTALSALILFGMLLAYNTFLNRVKSKNEKNILTAVLILAILLHLLFSSESGIEGLFKLSNRSYNFIYNIPVLVNSGRLWIGLGLIGSGEFYQLSQYNTFFVDNYFLYILMSTGIIGLIFIVCFMIYIGKSLVKHVDRTKFGKLTLIVFCVNVFSSLGETCFMYPAFTSCFAYTVLYLLYACGKSQPRTEKIVEVKYEDCL